MENLQKKAALVRKLCLEATTAAGSGHPTSCLSAADITTVLFDKYFTYDLDNPLNPVNDRFVLSKGHASPLLYTLFAIAGGLPLSDLKSLRKFDSPLEGHPTPHFKYTDGATGSLGQGLSIGAGLAYGIRSELKSKTEKLPKVFTLLGDGELAEGQVWEAANFASHYALDNLIAIADINKLAQSQETMFGHRIDEYVERFRAFGFEVLAIDGHNFTEIDAALHDAVNNTSDKPYAIIAKTFKGRGVSFLENKDGWHGKALKQDDLEKALGELGEVDDSLRFELRRPAGPAANSFPSVLAQSEASFNELRADRSPSLASPAKCNYKKGEEIATREVYGHVLAELGSVDQRIYALDGDVKNSTYSQEFLKVHPKRFIECFIAEQNMVGVAAGLSRLGKKPFVSTFGAFFTRAADQIRMAAIGRANIAFCGSHAGVSIGEDGPSQMGLEDIALFGAIPSSIIFHPSDAVSTHVAIHHMLLHNGISYLRTLRSATPVLYDINEVFPLGGSKILRQTDEDVLTVVAAGITVHEALKAHGELKKAGVHIRVVDCYSIKPIDKKTLIDSLDATKQRIIVTVEDHFEHGGLGDFVLAAISETGARTYKMAVNHLSRSGKKDELMSDAGIDAEHIIKKVKTIID